MFVGQLFRALKSFFSYLLYCLVVLPIFDQFNDQLKGPKMASSVSNALLKLHIASPTPSSLAQLREHIPLVAYSPLTSLVQLLHW